MKIRNEKRNYVLAITAVLMLQSVMAFSQSNIKIGLYKPGTEIAELKVDNLKKEDQLSVAVKDAQGNTLFTDHTANAVKYVKRLDFAKISNGVYSVDIIQPKGLIRKVVVKDESGISFKEETYVFHNYIKYQDDDKKLLVKFNNGLNESVSIRIIDKEGHILHEETGIRTANYAAVFNLSQLAKGSYKMSVTSGDFTNNRLIQL